ncbi:MFS transporter [Zhenhengia yiwuensis]|uniref:MFS transporter n=1 Tax=Zhenhengia yiwuensis TaxID=2763666 RepID=UPI002A7636CE|nr:MFS transporter [Zhenhengia yiwuensis]MDY3368773.1 MFS transporter [Zhenhengia yiwuensis]
MNIYSSYKDLKTEKEYWKLFVANTISRLGDSIDAIAYSWMAYEITNSASWLAIIMGVNAIPTILFQPLVGALVERINQKKLMVLTDLGRGLIVFLTALFLITGDLTAWILLIFTFLNSTLEAFRMPAGMAVYPKIISKEKYTLATSLNQSISQIAQIIGMAAAGFIIGLMGTGGAIMIDATTFIISGIILSFLKLKQSTSSEKMELSFKNYVIDLKEGLHYFKSHKLVLVICLLGSLMNVIVFPIGSFQAVYINDTLGLAAIALSVSSIAFSLGMALTSYLYPKMSKHIPRYKLFLGSWGVLMVLLIALSLNGPHFIPTVIWIMLFLTFFLSGCSLALLNIAANVSFMEHVEENYLARIGGLFNSMVMLATPIASFFFALIAKFLNISQIFLLTGISGMILLIVMCFNQTLKKL